MPSAINNSVSRSWNVPCQPRSACHGVSLTTPRSLPSTYKTKPPSSLMAWSKECKDPMTTRRNAIFTLEKKVSHGESFEYLQSRETYFVSQQLLGRENPGLRDVQRRISAG